MSYLLDVFEAIELYSIKRKGYLHSLSEASGKPHRTPCTVRTTEQNVRGGLPKMRPAAYQRGAL